MRFGKTLEKSVYEPWKSHYIDYAKLKGMLREDEAQRENFLLDISDRKQEWTEDDESAFVEQLVNVQLENVNTFQVETYKQLQERTTQCESRLEDLIKLRDREEGVLRGNEVNKQKESEMLDEVLEELDSVTKEITELEKFSRLNFTGFLKAAKKHDRRRGSKYRVRPLLKVRLAALPFNTEDYSPLLYRSVR